MTATTDKGAIISKPVGPPDSYGSGSRSSTTPRGKTAKRKIPAIGSSTNRAYRVFATAFSARNSTTPNTETTVRSGLVILPRIGGSGPKSELSLTPALRKRYQYQR